MLRLWPVAALMLSLMPVVSVAADDVGALRAELQALKDEYGTRVDALEARIQQLEAASGAPAASAAPAAPASSDMLAVNGESRMASGSPVAGGSIAMMQRSCRRWFCTMSRNAPV